MVRNLVHCFPIYNLMFFLIISNCTIIYSTTDPLSCHSYQIFCPYIQEKVWKISVWQRSQTCWSVFRARNVLSFIYGVALPWSSMSHFHCWCWCHFANASMGTGICMTPPPPPLTTNSSFNTSAKCPVRHTVFELVPFSLFVLNNETFVYHVNHSVKQISLLISN